MFILTPSELLNPRAITVSSVPKRVLGRGLGPGIRGTVTRPVFWRLVLEVQFLRYMFALLPFPLAMAVWPHLALPISQAPLLMLIVIWAFESRVLSYPDARRAGLIGEDAAARGLDLLALRSRDILTRIAARRDLPPGAILHLVVEQSEMARVPPLTVVSVQVEAARYELLELAAAERALIDERLFGGGLDERLLARINQAQKVFLRSAALDARGVSAHARLAALAG